MKEYKYWLDVIFKEKNNTHCICETWKGNNLKSISKNLAEVLDVVDCKGNIIKPNFEVIKDNLKNLMDIKAIKKEYNRLLKNYNIYTEIVEKYKNGCMIYECSIDKNTKISISSFI